MKFIRLEEYALRLHVLRAKLFASTDDSIKTVIRNLIIPSVVNLFLMRSGARRT